MYHFQNEKDKDWEPFEHNVISDLRSAIANVNIHVSLSKSMLDKKNTQTNYC